MSDLPQARILIVDDEPINLELFDVMLSNLGFEVEMAGDGEEALEKLVEVEPDLIVLDNVMPKLTGWEVTKRIKNEPEYAAYRHVPIIMFSAMDEVKDKIEGLELGVDDYITKPFNFSEVLARIRAVLHRHELTRQLTRRERRLDMIEALNESLVAFSQGLKQPLNEQLEKALAFLEQAGGQGADGAAGELATAVQRHAAGMLEQIARLENETAVVRGKEAELKAGELNLEQLQSQVHRRLTKEGIDEARGAVGSAERGQ
jgi:DNA-binding response OmpR family regulator